jgi:D-alanyl-D-alanine carboxypeptidase
MMQRKSVPFFVVVLLFAATLVARADKTDDFIKAEMTRQNIPGLSVAVVKDGKIIKAAGYGVADIKLNTPAKPETVYKIASVSKQFIATAIMLLIQDRRIGLDDPISRYLEGTPATWSAITIRHLLTHTSGLVREAPGFDPFKVQTDADLIKTAYSVPLRFAPGEKWEYGNLGYYALAEALRRVSGRPWGEYLTEKVFKPSGMNSTWTTNTKENVPKFPTGRRAMSTTTDC